MCKKSLSLATPNLLDEPSEQVRVLPLEKTQIKFGFFLAYSYLCNMELISDIETTDIKASYTASRVLWALLNTIFADDEDDDALSFSDKELLIDILRYGTIIEASKLKGVSCNKVSKQLEQVLARLTAKLDWLKENGPEIMLERAKAMMQAEACQQTIKRQELDLIEAKANILYLKTRLTQAQNKLERKDDNKVKLRDQIESLKKELLNADKTIIDLRYTNRKLQSELKSYKAKDGKLKEDKANEKLALQLKIMEAKAEERKTEEAKAKQEAAETAKTQKQIENEDQLAQALTSLKKASAKEQALLRKITKLENLVEWYKRERFQSGLPEPSEP